jgi:hypothetical protein
MKKLVIVIALMASIVIIGCSEDNNKKEDLDASVDGCPVERPTEPYLSCSGNQSCGYGFTCCCGACSTAIVCNCVGGRYDCFDTDVCADPWCADAGVDGGSP